MTDPTTQPTEPQQEPAPPAEVPPPDGVPATVPDVVAPVPSDLPTPAQVAHDAATRLGTEIDKLVSALVPLGLVDRLTPDLLTVQNFVKGLL